MTVHRAIMASLCVDFAAAACRSPAEPSGSLVPAGRYQLVHIRGDRVPGWVGSVCSSFQCDSTWVQGGTLEFAGGNACTWTLETAVGTEAVIIGGGALFFKDLASG